MNPGYYLGDTVYSDQKKILNENNNDDNDKNGKNDDDNDKNNDDGDILI